MEQFRRYYHRLHLRMIRSRPVGTVLCKKVINSITFKIMLGQSLFVCLKQKLTIYLSNLNIGHILNSVVENTGGPSVRPGFKPRHLALDSTNDYLLKNGHAVVKAMKRIDCFSNLWSVFARDLETIFERNRTEW